MDNKDTERVDVEQTVRLLAEAQDKTYWLERWHLDLNKLMRDRRITRLRNGLRGIRQIYRLIIKVTRKAKHRQALQKKEL